MTICKLCAAIERPCFKHRSARGILRETAQTTPIPLHAGSPQLRDRRYEANVHGPKNLRGGYPRIAEGRFTNQADAKRWADEVYPDAYLVNVTLLSAQSGWRMQPAGRRLNGEWE